ncbi:3',5'-cyclic AMP phosphodiesterase CpdA [Methylobacterium sp. RAS18]|nr:3',5'-cyclic AMP phosphodiesterase CpdA [Methylobacterium sp. RAS18]
MSILIVHLSDLHFGPKFDLKAWAEMKRYILLRRPQVIAVTGDLVDHPSPLHLLAAKAELERLTAEVAAELIVIPGNHDLYWSGVDSPITRRHNWYERIFGTDTAKAQELLGTEMGEVPGFSQAYKEAAPSAWHLTQAKRFASLLPPAPAHKRRLVRPRCCPQVLFALFDSNQPTWPWGLAGGAVARGELQDLATELQGQRTQDLVRIALIHHHVLPIAYSHEQLVGGEQFMVLRNAGDVLSLLAEHHFDLVLHGHKHKPQFARLDFSPADREGYTLSVAAAGSTAAESDNDERRNCFNAITVEANGRVGVRSTAYGTARALSRAVNDSALSRQYEEPPASVKRRAYVSALARGSLRCKRRHQRFSVSEAGDLEVTDRFEGWHGKTEALVTRQRHGTSVPEDGWFVDAQLRLDREAWNSGYRLESDDAPHVEDPRKPTTRHFTVVFPEGGSREAVIAYDVAYACGNSVNMTRWEAEERTPKVKEGQARSQAWAEEWVGVDISRPTTELVIELKLPDSLGAVTPYLSCLKPGIYPPLYDDDGEGVPGSNFSVDSFMTHHEKVHLRYDREGGVWQVTIAYPIMGYKYQLRWETEEHEPDEPVRGQVLSQRRTLLESAHRRGSGGATEADTRANKLFHEFAAPLATLIGSKKSDELRHISILSYRSEDQALVPVFTYGSGVARAAPPLAPIPLGRGIAGAAFQQCRSIPWAAASSASPFVRPFPSTVEEPEVGQVRTILSIPIFDRSEDGRTRPHPSSAIAVATFASSADDSNVTQLIAKTTDSGAELHATARTMAHALVQRVLVELEGI